MFDFKYIYKRFMLWPWRRWRRKRYRAQKKEDCTDYKLTDFEKVDGDSCCYVVSKYKNSEEEYKGCSVYNKQYITKEYIDEYIKGENEDREENYKLESYSIECRSNWISFSFIFAFLVFLF